MTKVFNHSAIVVNSQFKCCLCHVSFFLYSLAERTEKIPMGSIKNVVTEQIEGHDDYHMMVCHVCC